MTASLTRQAFRFSLAGMTLVGIQEVRAAAERIARHAVRTPLLPCLWADEDRPLWLKPESLQPVGAFKIRGAVNKIASLTPAERSRGVVTHSSGNHAQAVAYAARQFGVPAVIVIPEGAAAVKIAATRALGAEVVLVPPAERERRAAELVAEYGYTLVPPYDDTDVIAGQATVGLEIAADLPDVAAVLVPVSGGGLISGVATAVKALCPGARVFGVEPELAADAAESFRSGRRVAWPAARTHRTIADGLRVTCVGALPWEHIRAHVDDIVTVSEREIVQAVRLLGARARLVAEPSGAVATAAYLFAKPALPAGRTVAIVSGGNVDAGGYAALLAGDAGVFD
jgi:threonine dehydratase